MKKLLQPLVGGTVFPLFMILMGVGALFVLPACALHYWWTGKPYRREVREIFSFWPWERGFWL